MITHRLKPLSTEDLFSILHIDLDMLKSGEWLPDAQTIELLRNVIEEIQLRVTLQNSGGTK